MISIISTKLQYNPETFTPQMEFTFIVDLIIASANDKTEDEIAKAIGQEVIKQAQVHHALTKKD